MTSDTRPHPSAGPDMAADTDARLWISDLVDGRLDGPDLVRGCGDFARDPACRATWHAYHLIGDVLRSDALAHAPARDAALLAAVRTRLADEPVVMAPAPLRAPRARQQVWRLPLAAAAGVVAVAGVLVVLQQAGAGPGGPGAAPVMAQGAPAGVVPVRAPAPAAPGSVVVQRDARTPEILRDARIDEYLRAHRETLVGTPAALPGGVVRSVEFTVPPR